MIYIYIHVSFQGKQKLPYIGNKQVYTYIEKTYIEKKTGIYIFREKRRIYIYREKKLPCFFNFEKSL